MAAFQASLSGRRTSVLMPHAVLVATAALELVLEVERTRSGSSAWLVLSASVAVGALLYLWRRQDELRLVPVLLIAIAFHLGLIAAHEALGAVGDQDVNSYQVYGEELVNRHNYPEAEYPVGAVLLFGLEWFIGRGAADTVNRLLMVPFQLVCVLAVWGLRTRTSRWLAAVVAIWPLNTYYWEYRFDLVPAAAIVLGLLLAHRGRWRSSGMTLAIGAAVKWSPALSFLVLAVWLAGSRRGRESFRIGAAFVATFALLNVPFYLWNPHNFLAAYHNQSGRTITNESLWYFPLRLLGLTDTRTESAVWQSVGAPHAADVAVVAIQVALLGAILGIAWSARGQVRVALGLAAIAPAAFLVTNKIFSPQFLVVIGACWAFAAALLSTERREQLRLGLLLMAATFANAFVYPYDLPGHVDRWQVASAVTFAATLAAVALILRRIALTAVAEARPQRTFTSSL